MPLNLRPTRSSLRLAVVALLLTGILHACGGAKFGSAQQTATPHGNGGGDASSSNDAGPTPCLGPEDCNNSDPCTVNVCRATGLCDQLPLCAAGEQCCQGHCGDCCDDAQCDDGIACTVNRCFLGACIATADDGACANDSIEMYCSVTGDCRAREPCAVSASGQCDDGDSCTDDACVGGLCAHDACAAGTLCCPEFGCSECCTDSQCNDDDPCTVDSCGGGSCGHAPLCAGDTCCPNVDGVSASCGQCCSQAECDDGVACTLDACAQGQCSNDPQNTACPMGETCGPTGCSKPQQCHGADSCPSDNPCLTGSCELGVCQFTSCQNNDLCCLDGCHQCCGDGDCDDQNACTDDSCSAGSCQHAPVACPLCHADIGCIECETEADCDDGNQCTIDSCTPAHTCDHPGGGCGTTRCCGGNACQECCSANDCISDVVNGGGPIQLGTPCASCDSGKCSPVTYCTDLQRCCNGVCALKSSECITTQ